MKARIKLAGFRTPARLRTTVRKDFLKLFTNHYSMMGTQVMATNHDLVDIIMDVSDEQLTEDILSGPDFNLRRPKAKKEV